jgi:hypothetical protein
MEEHTVEIHGDIWKIADIQDDIAWCKEQTWTPSTYSKDGDHDHCSICWWALTVSDDPNVGRGYITGKKRWLCSECYDKFIKKA